MVQRAQKQIMQFRVTIFNLKVFETICHFLVVSVYLLIIKQYVYDTYQLFIKFENINLRLNLDALTFLIAFNYNECLTSI